MSIQVKEVSKFDKGLHGSISEQDISPEAASLSLNIDPNSEYGALRGIYGDKILSANGWEPPRRFTFNMEFFTDDSDGLIPVSGFEKKYFIINAYDKQYLLVFVLFNNLVENTLGGTASAGSFGNNIGISPNAFADTNEYDGINSADRVFNVIPVLLENLKTANGLYIKVSNLAIAIQNSLNNYTTTSSTLEEISGFENYFTSYRPDISNELDGRLVIQSNFLGDIDVPFLPKTQFPTGGNISGWQSSDTAGLRLPDHDIYSNPTSYIRGNGFTPAQTFDGTDGTEEVVFSFLKIKSFNSKGNLNILGIDKSQKIQLFENISESSGTSPQILGQATISDTNSVSIEQRNKNLYLGLGDNSGTSSLWVGHISRNQLGKDIEGYQLEKASLNTISPSTSSFNYSNLVMHTLHHGLNYKNGGIAGAASLYCDRNDSLSAIDQYGTNITNNSYQRTVNGWVVHCLKNNPGSVAEDYDRYADAKLGMIFRVNLGAALVTGNIGNTPTTGLSAFSYLRELKQLAKGDFALRANDSNSDESLSTGRGGSGEALHDGDLFQLVYIPEDGNIDFEEDNTEDMFRLVYLGSLFGKEDTTATNHPSFADSDDAYCGIPAYGYAHIDDGETLHRIKLSSKSDTDFASLANSDNGTSTVVTSSDGLFVSKDISRIESLNLRVELGVSDFVIGTIAECKSCDGLGGFGGDISDTKKNYFTGHGKLWITNKNEHDVIYLVDVTNWDGYNTNVGKLQSIRVELDFTRIHNQLVSNSNTNYGNGLIRLWDEDNGTNASDKSYFDNYEWNPEPIGQHISSICETYSHLPHMGDGALGGANSGDGKWRVWVEYKKPNEAAHYRYDLFLFNFRPQEWTGAGADTGNDLSSSAGSTIVYMFDKTPPYQECQKVTISDNIAGYRWDDDESTKKTIYYPFDKFAIKRDAVRSDTNYKGFLDSDWGRHNIVQAKGQADSGDSKLVHNSYASEDSRYMHVIFRNPSGEYHALGGGTKNWYRKKEGENSPDYEGGVKGFPISKIWLGSNIGWVLDSGREYIPVRHTLKPYYKKWYFTGDTGSSTIPHAEEDNYMVSGKKTFTAHIVSSFGKLNGKFVKDGGSLASGREKYYSNIYEYESTPQWFSNSEGKIEHYENQYTMFTLHDSPVAIETYSTSNTPYEVQGKPMTTPSEETVYLHGSASYSHRTRIYQNDTEAGFMGSRSNNEDNLIVDTINHSSVSATMGYSKYNQYRYHHANSGTDNVASDTATTGETESYDDGNTYGYGGQYYGQDGFGHYVNITQTWACNQDYLPPTKDFGRNYKLSLYSSENEWDPNNLRTRNFRSHGWGDGASFQWENQRKTRYYQGNLGQKIDDRDGRWWWGDHFSSLDETDETYSRHGTGYFTYGPNQEGSAGIGAYDRYRNDLNVDNSTDDFKLKNSLWDNRRIVHCWSTTCLTDSILNYNFKARATTENDGESTPTDKSFFDHREWGLWKTPRCSFRKLVIPSEFGDEPELKNVDIISWADRNVVYPNKNEHLTNNQIKTKSGFLVSFELPNSNVSDLDNSATGVIVYEAKNNTYFTYKRNDESVVPFEDAHPTQAHSKAAIDFLRSVYFTTSVVNSNSSTINSNWNVYSNTSLIAKNIVPGLSDDTSSNYSGASPDYRRGQGVSDFHVTHDVYSPVTISQDGSEEKQSLGIWYRAQFTETPYFDQELRQMTTKDYPYYVFDRFWNYWSVDENTGFDRGGNTENQFITEGWGSTAGVSANVVNADDAYPANYSGSQDNNALNTVSGAHVKKSSPALLTLESNIEDTVDNPEFPAGTIHYKFSFLYDGFQESPLSLNAFPINVAEDSSLLRLKLTVSSAKDLDINSRVTHINIYRRNNSKELYRLVRSVNLSNNKDSWGDEDEYKVLNFNDEQRMASYEGINGVAESLTSFTPNYRLSCQLNDFLFTAGIYHPNIEDGDHIILRSKQGRFSVFDWSNDFLDIPTKPVAIVAFANRIWVFDTNNVFKINPTGLYVEDRTEGIGILNSDSFIVTDMGMFWCDRNNIYKHDGQKINQIGTSILKNHANPEWQLGYIDAVNKSEKLGYTPKLGYDPINQCIYVAIQGFSKSLLSYKKYDGRIYSYDIKQDRWDYYDSPGVKTMTTDGNGDVLMSDGYQIYNYRRDKKSPKSFSWDSKTFQLGSANYKKTLKSLKFNGDLCLWRFNNSANLINETALDDLAEEAPDFEVGDNEHELEVTGASESDDLKVYVDGILQTMRIKAKNPVI